MTYRPQWTHNRLLSCKTFEFFVTQYRIFTTAIVHNNRIIELGLLLKLSQTQSALAEVHA